jgi:hypothetical protein
MQQPSAPSRKSRAVALTCGAFKVRLGSFSLNLKARFLFSPPGAGGKVDFPLLHEKSSLSILVAAGQSGAASLSAQGVAPGC